MPIISVTISIASPAPAVAGASVARFVRSSSIAFAIALLTSVPFARAIASG